MWMVSCKESEKHLAVPVRAQQCTSSGLSNKNLGWGQPWDIVRTSWVRFAAFRLLCAPFAEGSVGDSKVRGRCAWSPCCGRLGALPPSHLPGSQNTVLLLALGQARTSNRCVQHEAPELVPVVQCRQVCAGEPRFGRGEQHPLVFGTFSLASPDSGGR